MGERSPAPAGGFRHCVEFAKEGPARFLSHLDLQAAMERSLRRARLPLAYTQGFHPRPRLQFEEALPLGWSSEKELLWVDLAASYSSREFGLRLAATAPPGVRVLQVYLWPGRPVPPAHRRFRLRDVELPADASELLAHAFGGPDGAADCVQLRRSPEGWVFDLQPSGKTPAPSMKKVLRSILGDEVPPEARVHRLSLPRQEGA